MKIGANGILEYADLSEVGITDGETADSLLGFWKFNGDAKDYSGNGYHATPTAVTGATGNKGLSYEFSGVSSTGITTNLVYPTTWSEALTISTWLFIPTSATWNTSFMSNIFARGDYAGTHGLCRNTTNNQVRAYWRSDTGTTAVNGTIFRDTWHFLIARFDGTNLALLIDGVSQGSSAIDKTGTPDTGDWEWGTVKAHGGAPGTTLEGKMGETKFWNRALTTEEINIEWKYGLTTTGMQLASRTDGGIVTDDTLYLNNELNEGF